MGGPERSDVKTLLRASFCHTTSVARNSPSAEMTVVCEGKKRILRRGRGMRMPMGFHVSKKQVSSYLIFSWLQTHWKEVPDCRANKA